MAAAGLAEAPTPLFSERILATLKSPGGDDADELELVEGALRSRVTGRTFPFVDGVPSLFGAEAEGDDVRGRVQDFAGLSPKSMTSTPGPLATPKGRPALSTRPTASSSDAASIRLIRRPAVGPE